MLTFDQALFCDDVRHEQNGKLIVIGMYTGTIQFDKFPAQSQFWMLAHFRADSVGDETFTIRIDVNGQEASRIEGSMTFEMPASGWVPFPIGAILVGTPGTLAASFETGGKVRSSPKSA
ncbi:MAG: hypothetical protein HZT43_08235 [Exiguobacterium profundum]|nr:MAG: hypothetical protein HZT43_08235 [Exiguobacterium profundum]